MPVYKTEKFKLGHYQKRCGRLKLFWVCRFRPAAQGYYRPDGLDYPEGPSALQKTVDGAEGAGTSKGEDEPPAAGFEGVENQHRGYCEQAEDG
jgi:hypothetical protein